MGKLPRLQALLGPALPQGLEDQRESSTIPHRRGGQQRAHASGRAGDAHARIVRVLGDGLQGKGRQADSPTFESREIGAVMEALESLQMTLRQPFQLALAVPQLYEACPRRGALPEQPSWVTFSIEIREHGLPVCGCCRMSRSSDPHAGARHAARAGVSRSAFTRSLSLTGSARRMSRVFAGWG